jgi:hypothetical protein
MRNHTMQDKGLERLPLSQFDKQLIPGLLSFLITYETGWMSEVRQMFLMDQKAEFEAISSVFTAAELISELVSEAVYTSDDEE